MPALTAADVVVTAIPGYDLDTSPDGRIGKHIYALLNFGAGDGSLTYPQYGIPMPEPGKFGMNFAVPYRWIDFRQPVYAGFNNVLYTYDPTVRSGAPYGTIRLIHHFSGGEFVTGTPVAVTELAVRVTGK